MGAVVDSQTATAVVRITTLYRRAVSQSAEHAIAIGQALIEARSAMPRGAFTAMVESDLPFGPRSARRFMAIARDKRILALAKGDDRRLEADPRVRAPVLPASWRTLAELTRLDDEAFDDGLKKGWISPETERQDVTAHIKAARRDERVRELAQASEQAAHELGERRYQIILADPPWARETWSEAGRDRDPANHYPTMDFAKLAGLPIDAMAAPVAGLFLWTTGEHLAQAMKLIGWWGFGYKSQAVWVKPRAGTGYWVRTRHEPLLIATRGAFPAPAPGTQIDSVIEAAAGRHSAKPDDVHTFIERCWPGLSRIELFARRTRPGWVSWGNEVMGAGT